MKNRYTEITSFYQYLPVAGGTSLDNVSTGATLIRLGYTLLNGNFHGSYYLGRNQSRVFRSNLPYHMQKKKKWVTVLPFKK